MHVCAAGEAALQCLHLAMHEVSALLLCKRPTQASHSAHKFSERVRRQTAPAPKALQRGWRGQEISTLSQGCPPMADSWQCIVGAAL